MRTGLLVLAMMVTGCEEGFIIGEPGPIDCDAMVVFSVNIDVEDSLGAPMEDASGMYRANGGAEVECAPGISRSQLMCGADEDGEIEVTVSAPDMVSVTESFTVQMADECHVDPVSATIVLDYVEEG